MQATGRLQQGGQRDGGNETRGAGGREGRKVGQERWKEGCRVIGRLPIT